MTERLWGARFAQDITPEVLRYTATVDVDTRLMPFDLWQDIAHTLMLGHQRIVNAESARAIVAVLIELYEQHLRGELVLEPEHEDVHLNIEHLVIARLGLDVGGRMHTARSRNDQVSADTRMYLRQVQLDAVRAILDLIEELLRIDQADYLAILPGYTHSQAAQPVSVAFWRSAHASILLRDVGRIRDAYSRTNQSPLGACALAGTSFNLDRQLAAGLMGFDVVLTHALDATSSRDYLIESAAAFAIGGTTLSRMAEEIVVWSGHEHRLCAVGDEFATGSSIMPQKKNPVVAELVRGRTGRTVGTLVQLLTMVKGVALGYSCDLQEDKPYLWDSIDTYLSSLRLMGAQTRTLSFDTVRGTELCWHNFCTATELANYLVTEHGISFRKSHQLAGTVVATLLERRETLRNTESVVEVLAELGHDVDSDTLRDILDPVTGVTRYTSAGGTAPTSVATTREELAAAASQHRAWALKCMERLDAAHTATFRAAHEVVAGAPFDHVLQNILPTLPAQG